MASLPSTGGLKQCMTHATDCVTVLPDKTGKIFDNIDMAPVISDGFI